MITIQHNMTIVQTCGITQQSGRKLGVMARQQKRKEKQFSQC